MEKSDVTLFMVKKQQASHRVLDFNRNLEVEKSQFK